MTLNIPSWIEQVFFKYKSSEFSTISGNTPSTYPVMIFYEKNAGKFITTSPPAFSRKVSNIKKNPKVSLLFSQSVGSGLEKGSIVLVQGTAMISDENLGDMTRLNKFMEQINQKQPRAATFYSPSLIKRFFIKKLMGWYMLRFIIEITPKKIYAWEEGDLDNEPLIIEV